MAKIVSNIQPQSYRQHGVVHERKQDDDTEFNAEIVPGKSIRIFGQYGNCCNGPQGFDMTFNVGDPAEYGSYNLTYVGKITAIGMKTVTIADGRKVKRLDLNTFCWRNWDFDLEAIAKKNSEWND